MISGGRHGLKVSCAQRNWHEATMRRAWTTGKTSTRPEIKHPPNANPNMNINTTSICKMTIMSTIIMASAVIPCTAPAAVADEHYELSLIPHDNTQGNSGELFSCLSKAPTSNLGDCTGAPVAYHDLGNGWEVKITGDVRTWRSHRWEPLKYQYGYWYTTALPGVQKNNLRGYFDLHYTRIGQAKPTKPIYWCAKTAHVSGGTYWVCRQIMGQGSDIPFPDVPAECNVMNDVSIDLGTMKVGEPVTNTKTVKAVINCNMDTTMKIEYKCDDPTSPYCSITSMPGVTHTVSLTGGTIATGSAKNGDKITMTSGNTTMYLTDTYTGTPTQAGAYTGTGMIVTTFE